VDVTEAGQEYVFEVDLPGLKPHEVQLRVDNDGLCISGQRMPKPQEGKRMRVERPSGAFLRQLPLPPNTTGEIYGSFADGVLELRVPKARHDSESGQTPAVAPGRVEVAP
jgi:HSP20 family protein